MGRTSFDTEDQDLISTIQDSVKTAVIDVEGKGQFLTREVFLPPNRPQPDAFSVFSLTGLADFINENIDAQAIGKIAVHVKSPTQVVIVTQADNLEHRRYLALEAKADVPRIGCISTSLDHESAIVELQSKFVQEGRISEVLALLGNVVLEDEIGLEDDGVTQKVTTQSGIDRQIQGFENPVALKPFRTFTEIEQPESAFILRMKKQDKKLFVTLIEADGGKWANTARLAIKEKLEALIEIEDIPILA